MNANVNHVSIKLNGLSSMTMVMMDRDDSKRDTVTHTHTHTTVHSIQYTKCVDLQQMQDTHTQRAAIDSAYIHERPDFLYSSSLQCHLWGETV